MMQASEAAYVTQGQLIGHDNYFHSVCIDSRKISTGGLFVAIKGENSDGHDYVTQAYEQGAVTSMVSGLSGGKASCIEVENTVNALGKLAAYWRQHFDIPMAAITGSNGKTTVTAMVASILNQGDCACLSPKRSFNNHIGVPLTLLRLSKKYQYAVIEMGMSNPGEIEYLADITRPTVALINNIAPAHLLGLGSVQAIAKAKAQIFKGLRATGKVVLNCDDEFADYLAQQASQFVPKENLFRFSVGQSADLIAQNLKLGNTSSEFELRLEGQNLKIQLAVPGEHNVRNALAAAAVAFCMGAKMKMIEVGLSRFEPKQGRLNFKRGMNQSALIDDTYNANPDSMYAAIDVLAQQSTKKILVLGAMGELGAKSAQFHYAVGEYAKAKGIDALLCLDEKRNSHVSAYVAGFGRAAMLYESVADLMAGVESVLTEKSSILVKGSRVAAMERLVQAIEDNPNQPLTRGVG